MRKISKVVFILFLSLIWVYLCQAEEPPHPAIPICEVVTSDSIQWFGYGSAGHGLLRWDGETAEWFTFESGHLQSNEVEKLVVDGGGRLWIIQLIDYDYNAITKYIDSGWEHQYPENHMKFEGIDKEGVVWISGSVVQFVIGSQWYCIGRYTDTGWTLYPVDSESIALDFSGENLAELVTPDKRVFFDGEAWRIQDAGPPVTGDGVDYFPLGDGYVWRYKRTSGFTVDAVELAIIGSLMYNGHRYYRFLDGRICRVDEQGDIVRLETNNVEQVSHDFRSCTRMEYDICIVEDTDTFWMRHREQIDTATGSLMGVYFDYWSGPHESEECFFADGYGLALHVFYGSNVETLSLESTSFERYAFPSHPALPLCSATTPDGYQWFCYGYAGYGLLRWDGETAEWFTVENGHLLNNYVMKLIVDSKGRLWILNSGFTVYEEDSWSHHFPGSGPEDMGLDREGNVWAYGYLPYNVTGRKHIAHFNNNEWTVYGVNLPDFQETYLSFDGDYLVETDTPNGLIGFDGDHWMLLESEGQPADDLQYGSWWFPLTVGNEWRYQRRYLYYDSHTSSLVDRNDIEIMAVIGTKTLSGKLYYVMLDGSLYRSDGHDVMKYDGNGGEKVAWDFTTCNPDRFGNIDENKCYIYDSIFGSRYRTHRMITVPAGDFPGYHITIAIEIEIGAAGYSFAEGIGPAYYGEWNDTGGEETLELLSYSITPPAPVGVADDSRPEAFSLSVAPNPFNPATTITFTVASPGDTRLIVYNLAGQVVNTLVNRSLMTGEYSVTWNGRDVKGMQMASGIYFVRLENCGKVATVKATMVK